MAPPPPPQRRESMPGSLPGTMGPPPPVVPKLRLSELGGTIRAVADGVNGSAGKAGVWPPPPPPLPSVRAAAQVPLPDSKDPASALATPRTPGLLNSHTPRSPLGAGASPLPANGNSRAALHLDARAETKVLRIQELQLRFINAKMKQSLAVRTNKVRCCQDGRGSTAMNVWLMMCLERMMTAAQLQTRNLSQLEVLCGILPRLIPTV